MTDLTRPETSQRAGGIGASTPSAQAARAPIFHLVRYFTLTSLIAFLIVAIVLGYAFRQFSVDGLIDTQETANVNLTKVFANTLWQDDFGPFVRAMEGRSAAEIRAAARIPELNRKALALMKGSTTFKIKVYDTRGITVYSTELEQIGEDKSGNAGVVSGLRGATRSELVHRDKFSTLEGQVEKRDLIQSYIPQYDAAGARVIGVFEVYSDVTALLAEIDEKQRYIIGIVVGLLAALYLALYTIVNIAEKIITRQSEERFHNLVEQSFTGICVIQGETLAYANPRFAELLGHAPNEIAGGAFARVVAAEDLAAASAQIQALVDGRQRSAAFGFRARRNDGKIIEFDVHGAHAVFSDRPAAVLMAQDITERKLADARLRSLSRAVEQSPASIVMTDRSGSIEYVNPRFEDVSGYTLDEVRGQNPRILKSGRVARSTYAELWQTITAGGEWRGELCNRSKDGNFYWEQASISGLVDESGQIVHFVAVKEDITERKRMEQEILALNQNLERRVAERTRELEDANRELDSFSYSISHDLRAPLRALSGFAQILDKEYAEALGSSGQQLLGRVMRNSILMGTMIDDLLRLSRVGREGLTLAPIELNAVVADVVRAAAAEYPNARVDVAPLPTVIGDAGLLRQVFENLVGNALKYSGKKGNAAVIEIGTQVTDGEMAFFVRDNGAGFDMRYADRLFGVFQRLHREADFPGIGVGLVIVKRIVERHGGRIWAKSAPNEGAMFAFTLGHASGAAHEHAAPGS